MEAADRPAAVGLPRAGPARRPAHTAADTTKLAPARLGAGHPLADGLARQWAWHPRKRRLKGAYFGLRIPLPDETSEP